MDNNNYYIVGYFSDDSKTSRRYVETIYKNSIGTDHSEQDALRIPTEELAVGIVEWLKSRERETRSWFVVSKVTTETLKEL